MHNDVLQWSWQIANSKKQENRTINLNGNTNDSSKHNNNDKSNNFVGNNNKNSYENNIKIITIKMA